TGPTPASQSIGVGQTLPFTWTYRTVGAGWVTFTGNATSTSPANASAPVTSSALTVPSPACHVSTLAANAGVDRSATCNTNAALGGAPAATGGAGNYLYAWTPAAGLSSATIANPNATPRTASSTYTLTVTDAEGCIATDSAVVTVSNA